ncbi:MAG TPA: hypothetical protein VH814_12035 [Steroidobacteraceae bacterium]|jgi:hypothetical protein
MDVLFIAAGCALMANIGLSLWLFSVLREEPIARELFALPNVWLGARPPRPQLLRLKFSLPWVSAPPDIAQQPVLVRSAFQVARVAGGAFPCLIAAFFVGAFVA